MICIQADCFPRLLSADETEVRRIRCNATVWCDCVQGNVTNFPILMTTLVGNKCDGGHYTCSPPKDCCKQGCCFLLVTPHSPIYRSTTFQPGSVFNPLFLGHWYFWLAVTATVAGILCACSLWRRHSQGGGLLCCRGSARDERASEPDSNGSCYNPPQYSRCNSFHQAPPPYSEVTSKPDLYPLIISYNAEPLVKNGNSSTGYIMVQYFKNFIGRPTGVGSMSATSTIDSLSSSFLCNATNEANTIIPPTYSNMGSLEEVTTTPAPAAGNTDPSPPGQLPRSASAASGPPADSAQPRRSPSAAAQLDGAIGATQVHYSPPRPQIRDNPVFDGKGGGKASEANCSWAIGGPKAHSGESQNITCDVPPIATHIQLSRKLVKNRVLKNNSQDSTTDEEHNFSDLLNLSVCLPSNVVHVENPIQSAPHLHELPYSVANSIGSDISSLANLGTPDSPPRATSPTVEMKELLDKIQQLPQQKSPVSHPEVKHSRNYFHKSKAKTLYMPLNEKANKQKTRNNTPTVFSRSWISRSAPCTPCGNFVPNFPTGKGTRSNLKGSKSKLSDGSPLLKEQVEDSEEDSHKDECL